MRKKNIAIGFVLIISIFLSIFYFRYSFNITNIAWIISEKLRDAEGKERKIGDVVGNKLTILNFWATWCAPCIEEMPVLSDFYELKKIDGVSVVGLAIDNKKNVKEFLQKLPVNHHILIASAKGTEIMEKIGLNELNSLPFTVMMDNEYNVLKIKLGKLTLDELLYWVNTAER